MKNSVVDPIQNIELSLRHIISEVLASRVGPNWLETEDHGLGPSRFKQLIKNQAKEKSKRPSIIVDQDLCDFMEFSELRFVLEKEKNIQFFNKIFIEWDSFISLLKKAERLRNPLKHHRFLYDHEFYLLEGISGEIQQYINMWHTGCRFAVNKHRLHFRELVDTRNKNNKLILESAKGIANDWLIKTQDYFRSRNIHCGKMIKSENEYSGEISSEMIRVHWSTSADGIANSRIDDIDYKSIEIDMTYSQSAIIELDDFLRFLDRRYYLYVFELDGRIAVNELIKIAEKRAEISPSSKGGSGSGENIIWESAEYGLGQVFRFGVRNTGRDKSEIFLQSDQKPFICLHKLISLDTILSYLLGDLPRRIIISLLNNSI